MAERRANAKETTEESPLAAAGAPPVSPLPVPGAPPVSPLAPAGTPAAAPTVHPANDPPLPATAWAGASPVIAPTGPWRSYKETVAQLAERIVEAQRPIRVLQALRWDDSVETSFLKGRPRENPRIDSTYYDKVDLGFDVKTKCDEFEAIARDIEHNLGASDPIAAIMMATALEYRDVVRSIAQLHADREI